MKTLSVESPAAMSSSLSSAPCAGASAAVRVAGVTYDYPGHRALEAVSFSLPPATITALVGPNGAGKTTLLRVMAALDEPMRGQVFINDAEIWENPDAAHRQMGYLPDHFGLYQSLSARRCLTYAALAHGLDRATAKKAVEIAAAEVNLRDMLDVRASALSRGQRQRLALAQVIIHRPRVLLLDEPASGLDPTARAELSDLLRGLAQGGMTILVSSHILAELEDYCDAMLVLEKGRLLAMHRLAGEIPEPEPEPTPTPTSSPGAVDNHVADTINAPVNAPVNTPVNIPTTPSADITPPRRLFLTLAENAAPDFDVDALTRWLRAHEDFLALQCQRGDEDKGRGERRFILTGILDDAAQIALLRALLTGGWPIKAFGAYSESSEYSDAAPRLQDIYRNIVSAGGKSA